MMIEMLSADELALVAAHVGANSVFSFKLVCRAMRTASAVARSAISDPTRARTKTCYDATTTTASAAAVEWAISVGADEELLCRAALRCVPLRIDVIDWFLARCGDNVAFGIDVCTACANAGDLAALEWARARGCEWDARVCSNAAARGHLAMLKWARANGCAWDADTCATAASGGHLETLKWARSNGCAWSRRVCELAAWTGQIDVLRWARANGCEWDAHTCASAAFGGELATLQWARANGCEWNARFVASSAAFGEHEPTIQWVRDNQ
jgi:hypothetical protein